MNENTKEKVKSGKPLEVHKRAIDPIRGEPLHRIKAKITYQNQINLAHKFLTSLGKSSEC